jgi:hypothetical protein
VVNQPASGNPAPVNMLGQGTGAVNTTSPVHPGGTPSGSNVLGGAVRIIRLK